MLLLTEDDVRQVLTMPMALEAVEQGLRRVAVEEAVNVPRTRCQTDHVMLHVLSAAAKPFNILGFKAYTTSRKGARFHITLYDGKSGELLALMHADYLGQVRTGAASGVATKKLARPDAHRVGVLGTGKQARTQLQAVCAVRPIRQAVVYSPTAANCAQFAQEMTDLCGISVTPVTETQAAVSGQDIVITATSAREPILRGEWLEPGMHLNIVGSNFRGKAEIDNECLSRANVIVVDSKEQARFEAGDLLPAIDEKLIHWADIHELGKVLVGHFPGRQTADEITLFKSMGVGIEDVVVAGKVYTAAVAAQLGRSIDW
jgi:ornithine cyclodeaminase/alanine dehydrogenase-like protein (mu-crystallin family)